ncbi:MAG: T9SS type A sorting domain-containing protein, partial [Rubricoccaceae bacterium]|nr:T9SS type A sorting domain-containing protein [Rubricoccaceae bacterium]
AIDSGTGAITYTHDGSATTTDSLTYTVDDVDGATSNVATVLLTVTPAQVSITETYDAGWGLVSLPATVPDPDYLAVFEGGAGGDPQSPVYVIPGTFYEFDGASYTPSPPELTLGVGAWLKFAQEATVTLDGDYVGSLDRVLGGGGWYLFSGPSCSVPVSALEGHADIVDGTVYGFNGAYFTPTTLEPGRAYWARVADGAAPTLTLTCGVAAMPVLAAGARGASPQASAARGARSAAGRRAAGTTAAPAATALAVTPEPDLAAFAALTVADGAGRARTLHFGASLPRDVDRGRFALPPVPPAGAFDARFDGGARLTEQAEARVLVQVTTAPLRIQADALPSGEYLLDVVVDGVVVATHVLARGAAVEVAGPPAAFEQGVALDLRPAADALPATFALRGAYPNPLRRQATVAFDLPEPADVRLEVYDVLGRRVAVVQAADVEAGASRTLRFQAEGLASGAYIFRLEATMASGSVAETGRLTVVR